MDVLSVVVTVVLCFAAAGVWERSKRRDRAAAVGRMAATVTVRDDPLSPPEAALAMGARGQFSVWVTPRSGQGKQFIGLYDSRPEADAAAHGVRRALSNLADGMTAETQSL